jgi:maleylacetoacetate isomerase
VLVQSLAILDYLDEVHPEPPFLPHDPIARARVRAVAQVIASDIHPLGNLGPRNYLEKKLGLSAEAIEDWIRHWIDDGFGAVERWIRPGPYAFGAEPTLADICLVPQMFSARRFKVDLAKFPRIAAADEAARAHPAFTAAAPERQPDAE